MNREPVAAHGLFEIITDERFEYSILILFSTLREHFHARKC